MGKALSITLLDIHRSMIPYQNFIDDSEADWARAYYGANAFAQSIPLAIR